MFSVTKWVIYKNEWIKTRRGRNQKAVINETDYLEMIHVDISDLCECKGSYSSIWKPIKPLYKTLNLHWSENDCMISEYFNTQFA
jgi:hypothetical protein